MRASIPLLIAVVLCVAGGVRADRGISEVPRSIDQLPQSVAQSALQHLAGRPVIEIDEIRFQGLPVLYEVEFAADGGEQEIALLPSGELAQRNGGAAATATLPAVVAEALHRAAGDHAAAVKTIRYEGIIVLYSVVLGGDGDDDGAEGDDADDDDEGEEGDDDEGEEGDDADEGEEGDDEDGGGASAIYIYPHGALAVLKGDLSERAITLGDLSSAGASALRGSLGAGWAGTLDEVRFEGVPVLYRTGLTRDGQRVQVSLSADGQAMVPTQGATLAEAEVNRENLPRLVSSAVDLHVAGGSVSEIEQISLGGVPVLYAVEYRDSAGRPYELFVYPGGATAQLLGGPDDDDDDKDGDEGDEDDGDDDDGQGDDGDEGDEDDGDDDDGPDDNA